jgi:hypothetical protein
MNVGTYFSVKDFLNYYIAGLIWCTNIALLLLPRDKTELENSLTELSNFSNAANLVLASVLILLIPYLIGFVLTPLSDKIGEQIRRRKPDPVKWVVEDPVKFPAGLKAGEIVLIKQYIRKYFHDKDAAPDNWFFQIRALVARDNSGASLLANRALDLTNFSESLVLPLPLLLLIIGVRLMILGGYLWGIVSLLLAIGVYILLSKRHINLRSYWVKHVYRAFIAICTQPEISNGNRKETPSE